MTVFLMYHTGYLCSPDPVCFSFTLLVFHNMFQKIGKHISHVLEIIVACDYLIMLILYFLCIILGICLCKNRSKGNFCNFCFLLVFLYRAIPEEGHVKTESLELNI